MLWNNQARCPPATWSHVFSAFSPECACVAALPRLSKMFPLSSLNPLCCWHVLRCFEMNRVRCTWRGGGMSSAQGQGPPQEEIACLKMLTAWHKVVAVLHLPCMASFSKTTLCWQAHPISYFSLNTNFIPLRQSWYSRWGSPSYVWLSFFERIAFSLTAVLLCSIHKCHWNHSLVFLIFCQPSIAMHWNEIIVCLSHLHQSFGFPLNLCKTVINWAPALKL